MEDRVSRGVAQARSADDPVSEGRPAASIDPAPPAVAEGDGRSPRSVYGIGDEPDVRFSLANERTALAWVRTGLALVAGGVALTTLTHFATGSTLILDAVAVVACVAGGVLAAVALLSWRRNERSLRLRLPLPAPVALTWLVVGVVVMALVLGAYAIFEGVQRL